MNNAQLELGLPAIRCKSIQRRARAKWWFDRMRQTVDGAIDHRPAPLHLTTPGLIQRRT